MLVYLSGAWVAGIWLGSPLDLPVALILAGLIPLPLLFFGKHRRRIVLASLCLLAFFGGAARFTSSLPPTTPDSLQYYLDQGTVTVTGTVADNPEVGDNTVQFQLAATEIIRDGQPHPVSGTALLVVPRYPAYHYGDTIRVTGELQTPPLLGGFDYAAYLARQGISATMYYPGVTLLGTGGGSRPLAWIYRLRERLGLALASVLPEPAAALAQGMVLGIRGNIPNTLQTSFSRTGTAHLLAISGLHLGILAGIMLSLGLWLLGRRHYLYVWLTLGAIWLYAVITGLHPPVVRAAIMATMFLAAELAGRPRRATTALAFAAAVMVGLNPPVLWAVSFQMSFLAMAGLIFIAPPLMARGRRLVSAVLGNEGALVPAARFATDSLSVTLGAVIAVWPLVADYFGVVSLVGPLATFLALPALPGIIITGALAGAIGLVALPAAQVVGWLAWLCLAYLQLVVNGLAALPLSSLEVTSVSPMLLWAYYAGLALALGLGYHWRQAGRLTRQLTAGIGSGAGNLTRPVSRLPLKWVLPPLLAAAVLVTATAATMPDDRLHLSFIDVGQGDAILIQTPAHQDILVDGGGSPQAISLGLGRQMPFWDRSLDLVVLTHPHADHLTGLVEVLRRYRVGQVLRPETAGDSPVYAEWIEQLRAKGVADTVARAGQRLDLGGGAVIEVLNPPSPPLNGTDADTDNNGVVLRVSLGEFSFLLTADIQREGELALVHRGGHLASTVLKVGHHGSDTSTSPGFLAAVSPQLALISVGAENPFGHPTHEVLDRLAASLGAGRIYRTDQHGTIEFTTDGERLWVAVER